MGVGRLVEQSEHTQHLWNNFTMLCGRGLCLPLNYNGSFKDRWSPVIKANIIIMKKFENYQNVTQRLKCCWKNSIGRLAGCRIGTDLQFVKKQFLLSTIKWGMPAIWLIDGVIEFSYVFVNFLLAGSIHFWYSSVVVSMVTDSSISSCSLIVFALWGLTQLVRTNMLKIVMSSWRIDPFNIR